MIWVKTKEEVKSSLFQSVICNLDPKNKSFNCDWGFLSLEKQTIEGVLVVWRHTQISLFFRSVRTPSGYFWNHAPFFHRFVFFFIYLSHLVLYKSTMYKFYWSNLQKSQSGGIGGGASMQSQNQPFVNASSSSATTYFVAQNNFHQTNSERLTSNEFYLLWLARKGLFSPN